MTHSPKFIVIALLTTPGCGSDHNPTETSPAPTRPPMAMDECGLRTGYPGDEACILPPPPDKGFQVHVGPADYANPDATYVLNPGDEKIDTFILPSGNESDAYFFYRQYRMRPGTHHLSLTAPDENGMLHGRVLGLANASQDFPSGGIIAPEDRGVGLPLAANAEISVSVHAVNATGAPLLREVWINFWYRDPMEVREPAIQWFKDGDVNLEVQPRQATTLGPYDCRVEGDGRLLWLYGHRHANNVRFTVTRVRGSRRDVIYDAFNWEEPLRLEYSSLFANPAPNPAARTDGGWSGILDVKDGDLVEWQCDVVNNHDTVLRNTQQTYLGEMCIMDAEAVGATCACLADDGCPPHTSG
jgi:hypothetical protein